jgi:hypothetical protein
MTESKLDFEIQKETDDRLRDKIEIELDFLNFFE